MSMSKTATCSLIGCPFAAQMGGASAARFSALIEMQLTGQARAHWPQPMQSSYFMKRRMRLFGGSGHFSVGYCRVTLSVNMCRQVIFIPTSTVQNPCQTSVSHFIIATPGRRAPRCGGGSTASRAPSR